MTVGSISLLNNIGSFTFPLAAELAVRPRGAVQPLLPCTISILARRGLRRQEKPTIPSPDTVLRTRARLARVCHPVRTEVVK